MSQRWDKLEERLGEYESELDAVYRLYHIPVLAALMTFMLWVRVRHYERMIGENGQPLYRGNDPYYHRRTTDYVIRNYPFNMPYEVWTGFDTGTAVGQFGTIFDQVVATIALIVGLGSPSESTVTLVTVLTPPVVAVLCVPPMYVVGRRLGGRFGGLIAVVLLALTPGQFLSRSVAGVYDHHIAEVLGTLLALAVGMRMLTVAQREKPIYEFIETREVDLLRRPVAWGAGFGAALALTMLVWPPAIFLVGIYGIFLFVHLSFEFVRGHSPDHVVIPSVVAMLVAAGLLLPFLTAVGLTTTSISLLQPLLALLVAGGAAFMAAVARLWERRELSRLGYPAGVGATGLVAAGVLAVVAPETFDFLLGQVERVAGLGSTDTAATVGEAQAPNAPLDFFFRNYGLAIYTAAVGVLAILVRALFADRPRAEQLLVAVFTAALVLFTLTQIRFDYYLVVGVAAANAYLVGRILGFIDLESVRTDATNLQPFQVFVVAAVLFVVAGPLVATAAPVASADRAASPGEYQDWQGSLEWLSEETPAVGGYGGADNADDIEYLGTYQRTDDFEYGPGMYGVMSWWDYGHYITYGGERVPVANPFQQNAGEAADFLLAGNESESIEALEADSGEGSGTRYVMIDYKLGYAGTTKYNAPVVFESRHGLDRSDVGISIISNRRVLRVAVHTQRAYESMRVRLYQFHGSAREPASFVVNFNELYREQGYGTLPSQNEPVIERDYNTSEEARQAAASDPTKVHGGLFGRPSERVEALEQFRLVHASEPSSSDSTLDNPPIFEAQENREGPAVPYVKTFERVEGATIEGTGPANTEVRADVVMEIPTTGQTFTYRQFAETDEQGNFEMTVPYSTTGYDEYGTEAGYTNVSVRQVVGENDTASGVELETPAEPANGGGDGTGESGGGGSDGSSGDGSERRDLRAP
ncbi:oligosaccharyl transferase, archaeosortase A system-associated [Halobacteriales archaeon QS_9_70_65]|nr:MAG: oligosaccharyl transferase, archaeosortase A system-associated [Halobacteriales archaeon QS_9_70_65]